MSTPIKREPRPLLPPDPQSILIVRLTARGDVLLASPIIKSLRERYPSAHIAWAVEPHTRDFVAHHPDLDEVIVWDRPAWTSMIRKGQLGRLLRAFFEFRAHLRSRHFDVALDLQGLLRSGAVTWLSGAPVRIALAPKEGSSLLMTATVPEYDRGYGGTSLQYPFFAEHVGLPSAPFALELTLDDETRQFTDRLITERALAGGYAVAAPFTTRAQKHWFEDRWGELIVRVRDELGLPVVLLGGPSDREAADRISERAGGGLIDLVGETRLGEAAAMVERATVFFGVDTGLTHVAVAFRRPSVLLFGSHIPYLDPPHEDARILLHFLECVPCARHPTCDGAYWCMQAITVDDVFETAESLLESSR